MLQDRHSETFLVQENDVSVWGMVMEALIWFKHATPSEQGLHVETIQTTGRY